MSRKYIIISIIITAVLALSAAALTASLYSGNSPKEAVEPAGKASPEQYPLLQAVPSDAAMVACFENFGTAASLMADSTKAVGALLGGNSGSLVSLMKDFSRSGSSSMKNKRAIVSVHYSGTLIPLLIVDLGDTVLDTTAASPAAVLQATAAKEGLIARQQDCADYAGDALKGHTLLLISESEPLINSSIRHIMSGESILSAKGFSNAVSFSKGKNTILANHSYAQRIVGFAMNRRFSKYSGFLGSVVPWSSMSVTEDKEGRLSMRGGIPLYPDDPSSYTNVFQGNGTPETRFPDVLPTGTDFAVALSVTDLDSYFAGYRRFLDSRGRLDSYSASNIAARGALGRTLEEWARHHGIKEVCKACFHGEKDLLSVVMCRTSGKNQVKDSQPAENKIPAAVSTLFGDIFSQEDNSVTINYKGWIITGSAAAIETLSGAHFLDITLRNQLSEAGVSARIPEKGSSFVLFYSMAEDPAIMDNSFRGPVASALRKTIEETTFTPAVFRIEKKDASLDLSLDVDRLVVISEKSPIIERDTTVVVPEGPFKVTNSGTGKTNLFYQNSNLFLCLKEETGKGLWGVPFKTPICGSVCTIDYYANGKLQFLFGAGSSLYLIDRLGRFVKPFPVDLGKEILIGPAAYDFTGAHGYTAMVLHKDNTIAMYDLHGKKPAFWKDITSGQTIKGLPELLEFKGEKYWIVRTSIQTHIFPFGGGEPLTKGTGGKMIRPESAITVDGGNIQAVCYDGKTRNVKL